MRILGILFLVFLNLFSTNSHLKAESSGCQYQDVVELSPPVSGYFLFSTYNSREFRVFSLLQKNTDLLPFSVIEWMIDTEYRADTIRIPQISPDGKYIAYGSAYSDRDLSYSVHFVWSVEEHRVISTFPWSEEWIHFVGWVDNELAFLSQDVSLSLDYVSIYGTLEKTDHLDNLNNTSINIAPYDEIPPDSSFFLWSTLSHSGNLVLWVRVRDTEDWLKIFNIESQEIFLQLEGKEVSDFTPNIHIREPSLIRPIWSHQGDEFVISLPDESWAGLNLHLFSLHGDFQQLISFEPEDGTENIQMIFPSWSHDDQYLAFWLIKIKDGRQVHKELVLFSLKNKELISTGITTASNPSQLVWNPTKNLVAFVDESVSGQRDLTIIDIENCEVMRQSENTLGITISRIYNWFDNE